MSIEMENPKTLKEKVDAVLSLVTQMRLAHLLKDEWQFEDAYSKSSTFLFELIEELDNE